MNITEFVKGRNVDRNAVCMYIRRHSKEFSGHTKTVGKSVELDEFAIELLEKKYPLPSPVEVVEDKESREKLLKAQEYIIVLQQQLADLKEQAALAEVRQLLIEDRDNRIDTLTAENTALQDTITSLKNRGFWDRLLNRW